MKKSLWDVMQLLSLTMVLAILAPAMSNAQAGKGNFAGNWVLNAGKSTLPQGGGPRMGGDFTVVQEANLLTRTRTTQDGTTRVSKYTLDGKECVNISSRGESKSTANWSDDGKTLTIVTKFNFNGNERTSTEVWSLTDPKTLSIESTRQTPDGEVKAKMIYDKK
jgi:hypothetical protein